MIMIRFTDFSLKLLRKAHFFPVGIVEGIYFESGLVSHLATHLGEPTSDGYNTERSRAKRWKGPKKAQGQNFSHRAN